MDFINYVKVRGRVGSATFSRFADAQQCRFTVVTEYVYKDRTGTPVMDTTWFSATAWEGRRTGDITKIASGAIVQLEGRIRTYKFTGQDGVERASWEVSVSHVDVLDIDEPLMSQPSL